MLLRQVPLLFCEISAGPEVAVAQQIPFPLSSPPSLNECMHCSSSLRLVYWTLTARARATAVMSRRGGWLKPNHVYRDTPLAEDECTAFAPPTSSAVIGRSMLSSQRHGLHHRETIPTDWVGWDWERERI